MAAPAFAVNTKLGMDFQNLFMYSNNMQVYDGGDTEKNSDDSDFRYAERLRLNWIAEDDEQKVRGTVRFEFDVTAGNGNSDDTRNGPGGDFEGDNTNFELAWAFIDFELPFDPASRAYMGLQPTEMSPYVFCDNAMGVRLVRSMGNADVALGWFRNDTGTTDSLGGDDKEEYADMGTLDLNFDLAEAGDLSLFGYFIDDGHGMNLINSNDSIVWWPESSDYGWADDASVQTYWTGLTYATEIDNFFGSLTGIYQGGTVNGATDTEDFDIKAYLVHGELGVNINKAYVALGWFYSSGDDDPNDDDVENFFAIDCDNTLLGSVALLESYDPNIAYYGPWIGNYGASHIYLNAGYEFTEKTDGRLGFIWFNSAEDIPYAEAGNNKKDDSIGYEINGQVDHAITENLSIGLAAGYLIGDDGWDALADNGDADDLFRVMSRVRFKF
jgi:hypothetical protein